MTVWYVDRSRYDDGVGRCAMLRYLTYHSGPYGYGMKKKALAVPLVTGTYTHLALAGVMENLMLAQQAGTKVGDPNSESARAVWRKLIAKAIDKYKAEVKARGYLDVDNPQDNLWIMEEQCMLVEGLAWCFIRGKLPEIIENYTVLAVEQEEEFVVRCGCGRSDLSLKVEAHTDHLDDPNIVTIVQMSKPDIILRRELDGRVGNHDFKTEYNVSDNTVESYRDSVQMAVGTVGAEQRLGVKIDHYVIHALIKGGRGVFSKKGAPQTLDSHLKKQYSPLCYAKVFAPNAPFNNDTTWDYKGFWFDKQPLWQVEFSQKPLGMSNSEFWVYEMPKEMLFEQFVEIGPFERPTHMITQALDHIAGEEMRWIKNLNDLYVVEEANGWESDIFQRTLNATIPRSYHCYHYNSRCPMYQVCFKGAGWQDPIGSGYYVHRRPHHEPEIVQMQSRGIPVPEEAGEEE